MSNLAMLALAVVLLAVIGLAVWSKRNNARLKQLDRRIRRQSELLEEIDSVLESPQLSEEEQLAKSKALLSKLRESRKP